MEFSENPLEPLFSIERLTLQLERRTLFSDFCLAIPRGARIGLIGRSGIGKSTLARAIASREWPSGSHWKRLIAQYRRSFYSAQKPNLPQDVTVGNLMQAFGATPGEWTSLFAQLGLDAIGDRRVRKLSGGEQQRLAFALAHLARADIDIFDEPLTGLDPDLKVKATTFLSESITQRAGSLLIISHDATTLWLLCDQVRVCGMSNDQSIRFLSPYPRALTSLSRSDDHESFLRLLQQMNLL